ALVPLLSPCFLVTFFFQAEDGIRYRNVTGVQTCALPIYRPAAPRLVGRPTSRGAAGRSRRRCGSRGRPYMRHLRGHRRPARRARSEERRVGKERGAMRPPGQYEEGWWEGGMY